MNRRGLFELPAALILGFATIAAAQRDPMPRVQRVRPSTPAPAPSPDCAKATQDPIATRPAPAPVQNPPVDRLSQVRGTSPPRTSSVSEIISALREVETAAEDGDYPSFVGFLKAARENYRSVGATSATPDLDLIFGILADVEAVWNFSMTDPAGAFFSERSWPDGYRRLTTRYPEFLKSLEPAVLTIGGEKLFPSVETRRYLTRAASQRLDKIDPDKSISSRTAQSPISRDTVKLPETTPDRRLPASGDQGKSVWDGLPPSSPPRRPSGSLSPSPGSGSVRPPATTTAEKRPVPSSGTQPAVAPRTGTVPAAASGATPPPRRRVGSVSGSRGADRPAASPAPARPRRRTSIVTGKPVPAPDQTPETPAEDLSPMTPSPAAPPAKRPAAVANIPPAAVDPAPVNPTPPAPASGLPDEPDTAPSTPQSGDEVTPAFPETSATSMTADTAAPAVEQAAKPLQREEKPRGPNRLLLLILGLGAILAMILIVRALFAGS